MVFSDLDADGALDFSPNSPEIVQTNTYYPFGMLINGMHPIVQAAPSQPYRYNGKELTLMSGLYDYGYRHYDPSIGRFIGVDPIAEKFPDLSVYNYASNDPIKNIDLHGLQGVNMASGFNQVMAHKYGTKEQAKAYQNVQKAEGMGTIAGSVLMAGGIVASSASAAGVGGKSALALLGNPLSIETSGTIIATNVAADGIMQTVTNLASGEDPVTNYDIVGGAVSAFSNPVVSNLIDGTVDVSIGSGIEINTIGNIATQTVVGGGLGKATSPVIEILDSAKNSMASFFNGAISLFTNGKKAGANEVAKTLNTENEKQR